MSDTTGQGQETGTASGAASQPAPIAIPEGIAAALGQPSASPAAPSGGQTGQQTQQQQEYQPSELMQGLLKGVPPEQQAVLEPYIKQWDAGVTRRFTELQSRYQPYDSVIEQGVSPEDLEDAIGLAQVFYQNPLALKQIIEQNYGQGTGPGAGQQAPAGEEFEELHPAVKQFIEGQQSQLGEMRSVMEKMAETFVQQRDQQTAAQEDEALDGYLGLLRTELGDFDEDFVLAKMEKGMDGKEAVEAYQSAVQSGINQRLGAGGQQNGGLNFGPTGQIAPSAAVPPVLSGGSYAPKQRSITEATPGEVKDLVQQILDQANQTDQT